MGASRLLHQAELLGRECSSQQLAERICRIPDLARLHRFRMAPGKEHVRLGAEDSAVIRHELDSLHACAQAIDCSHTCVELALITDENSPLRPQAPFFTSFVACTASRDEGFHDAYVKCLRNMAAASQPQIVPHADLFRKNVAGVFCTLSKSYPPKETRPSAAAAAGPPPTFTVVRQPFASDQTNQPDVAARIEMFFDSVVASLLSSDTTKPIGTALATSTLVVIPFTRGFDAALRVRSNGLGERGIPGGVLFSFLDGPTSQDNLDRYVRLIQWVLSEAVIQEAVDSFPVAERKSRSLVSYSVTHPLKHRLGELAAATRYLREDVDSLDRATLAGKVDHVRDLASQIYDLSELAHILHYATLRTARELFGETRAHGQGYKYAETGPVTVASVLDQAAGYLSEQPIIDEKPADNAQIEGFVEIAGGVKLRLPVTVYRECVFEVLRNCMLHGSDGRVRVQLEDVNGAPALMFSNACSEASSTLDRRLGVPGSEGWAEIRGISPTGLTFVAHALRLTESGTVLVRYEELDGRTEFKTALSLSGLVGK